MAGTCKSDAIQSSRHRNKFAAQAIAHTWSTHKDKVAKKETRKKIAKAKHLDVRAAEGKPKRGDARAKRRYGLVTP